MAGSKIETSDSLIIPSSNLNSTPSVVSACAQLVLDSSWTIIATIASARVELPFSPGMLRAFNSWNVDHSIWLLSAVCCRTFDTVSSHQILTCPRDLETSQVRSHAVPPPFLPFPPDQSPVQTQPNRLCTRHCTIVQIDGRHSVQTLLRKRAPECEP